MSVLESIILMSGLAFCLSLLYTSKQKWGSMMTLALVISALAVSFSWPLLLGTVAGLAGLGLLHRFRPELATATGRENTLRDWVQHMMGLAIALVGCQYIVYYSLLAHGIVPDISRPDVVDAFLPIAAGLEIKAILTLNFWDKNHPAAAVMLTSVLLSGVFVKRAFCGWFCPVGLAGQYIHKLRTRLIKGEWNPPKWLDWPLRMLKYLLLAGLLYIVVLAMPKEALPYYLNGHYMKIADLKTAMFFVSPGVIGGTILLVIFLMAAWQKQSFCRYLCPYGAALGLLSFLSPFKVRRDTSHCLNDAGGMSCDKCTRACPARIQVHVIETVRVDECQSCMRCISACPKKEALSVRSRWGSKLSARGVLIILLLLMFGLPLIAHMAGFWHSQVSDEMRMELIRYLHQINH
ncbi:4Fe-4S binding protein [Vibrio sp. JC009]|uniref:4Fe-4S binding protein n=1 Tax=Vibrio sp. JC009 TaxID=2912314 RepID=UPI0023B17F87|nr:4Fe-4S binding protein [Vibrio sp. JC009]WED24701.1 4Fe-4S binding protein [Vibrio sp. JC009]